MSASRTQLKGVLHACRAAARIHVARDRASRVIRHLLRPLPEEGVRGAEQRADADHGGRNGAERRLGESRERLLADVGKPSFSNGTLDRYSTLVPPSSFSP